MSIRLYFTVKKRDVLEGEVVQIIDTMHRVIVPASIMESVKAELQLTAGVTRTTDGEGGLAEKKGALMKRSPPKIR